MTADETPFPIHMCRKTENHTEHEWVDGINTKYCPGRADTKIGQPRPIIPPKHQCANYQTHEPHIWHMNEDTPLYCNGVASEPPEQKWPCGRLVIHEPHESADGTKKCMGITVDEYVRHVMPALVPCDDNATHLPHGHCPGKESTEEPLYISSNSSVWCANREAHEAHRWSADSGLNYKNCPGIGKSDAVLLGHGIVAPSGKFYCKNVKGCTGHIPTVPLTGGGEPTQQFCGLHGPHVPHTWHEGISPTVSKSSATLRKCPGYEYTLDEASPSFEYHDALEVLKNRTSEVAHDPEKASTPKWNYYCETYEGGNLTKVVKRYGDSRSGGIIAEYRNPVYARIVADALNGGVILGFEVEK